MGKLFRYMRAQYWARQAGKNAGINYLAEVSEGKREFSEWRAEHIYNMAYKKELEARYNG